MKVCSPSEDERRVSLTHQRDGGKSDRRLSLRILYLPPHLDLSEEVKGGEHEEECYQAGLIHRRSKLKSMGTSFSAGKSMRKKSIDPAK